MEHMPWVKIDKGGYVVKSECRRYCENDDRRRVRGEDVRREDCQLVLSRQEDADYQV